MKILLVLILLLSSSFAVADEEHSFWSNVDKFLGKIADGVSKKDAITGLRTIDSPFHNEKDYKIFSDKISYFKNEEKIITNGKTEVLIGADYKIETEELVFYKDKLIVESKTQSKFFNYTEQLFLGIKRFVYSINEQELKARKKKIQEWKYLC